MKLATVRVDARELVALRIVDDTLVSLESAYRAAGLGPAPRSVLEIVQGGDDAQDALRRAHAAAQSGPADLQKLDARRVEWLAPVTRPGKILAVAFNNNALTRTAHVAPKAPMYFLKPPSCLTGHNQPIVIQENYGYTMPELELAAVVGKRGSNIARADALGHVFGYSIINDVTSTGLKFTLDSIAIDLPPEQIRPDHVGWRRRRPDGDNELYFTYHTRSKGCDTFGPMGPWLTTADEVENPNRLEVHGWLAGEPFAVDSTANYTFPIEDVIADASKYFTLEAGDIVHFGTSGRGVGRFATGHRSVNLYNEHGPIDIEITGLGRLSNPVMHNWKQ
jgi:2-keto-4-pentenoate hydratase/2-oxohepta-3-ene-1,7-dioic acid hydratase in catechol pathway